jgi:hypothetical protein
MSAPNPEPAAKISAYVVLSGVPRAAMTMHGRMRVTPSAASVVE